MQNMHAKSTQIWFHQLLHLIQHHWGGYPERTRLCVGGTKEQVTGTAAEKDERGRRLATTGGVNRKAAQTPQSRQM